MFGYGNYSRLNERRKVCFCSALRLCCSFKNDTSLECVRDASATNLDNLQQKNVGKGTKSHLDVLNLNVTYKTAQWPSTCHAPNY